MPCTSKTQPCGVDGQDRRDGFIWFLWPLWSIWLVWSVSFVWLEQTKRINQRNQMNQINQTSSSTREKPRAMDYGVFAHRNPVSPWSVGVMRLRFAERVAFGLLYQEPPRITLVPPDEGPIGFFDGLFL